jgi:predicted transglutaminase-like cysteine proteinase
MSWSNSLWPMALSFAFGLIFYACVIHVKSQAVSAGAASAASHLSGTVRVEPPPGFKAFCARESWSCGGPIDHVRSSRKSLKRLAKHLNSEVNNQIKPESDLDQYGVPDYWSIPTSGKGDCEDYALLKMKLLLERGAPADKVFLAVVITNTGERHLVLVVRTTRSDLILDNIENRVLDWRETRHRFIAIQDPSDLTRWVSVKRAESAPAISRLGISEFRHLEAELG